MKLQVSNVYERNYYASSRIVVNQGGTRSSKTYSILQMIIVKCISEWRGVTISICRKTFPSLRITAMRDFFEILRTHNLYDESMHNKSGHTYLLFGNLIEFLAMDDPVKKRGAKRDYLFMNEAIEFDYEDFRQLMMRTTTQAFIDYNPSDEFHWIYDNVLTRDDVIFIQSTYLDNPFLPKALVDEIEKIKNVDENYWKIYGLGEKGVSGANIYTNYQLIDEFPEEAKSAKVRAYGVDFGFNNPSVVVDVRLVGRNLYIDEVIYQTQLVNSELILSMKSANVDRSVAMYCDVNPDRIEEIKRAGFNNAKTATKNVKEGIDRLKSVSMFVTKNSVNTIKELRNYKWKVDSNGVPSGDEPVKFNDHALDAIRYASYNLIADKKLKAPKTTLI